MNMVVQNAFDANAGAFDADVVIKNQGTVATSLFNVGLFFDRASEPITVCDADTSGISIGLAPGETSTLTFRGISYSSGGPKKLWAWADYCNLVAESDNSNNTSSGGLFRALITSFIRLP